MRRNLTTLMVDHKNKWESVGLMDNYNVVGIFVTPYPRLGVLINIVSKEDIAYYVTIGDVPHCTCPDSTKMSSQSLEGKKDGCTTSILILVFRFLCKVDYDSEKFIHAPTFTNNKAMRLLELDIVVHCE